MDKTDAVRIDKWLWCARFFKTRSLAAEEIAKGRVQVNGAPAKASREVRAGDTVDLRQGRVPRSVVVRAVASTRGPAPVAQQLYEETAESLAARALAAERQRLAPEPAAALHDGRPTKRERRAIDQARNWGERWSASVDDSP